MPSNLSDEALLEAARAGQRDAIEALLERHEPQIYRFARRMCGRPEDARDVLQETLLAAFTGLPEFRGEANLSTWLFQVARSFCSKTTRTRVGEPGSFEALDAPETSCVPSDELRSPAALAHARELSEVLRAAMATLPEHYREVLLLKDVEGLSAEQVAEVVGEKVPAVKSRLHRARVELRAMLESVLGEGAASPPPRPRAVGGTVALRGWRHRSHRLRAHGGAHGPLRIVHPGLRVAENDDRHVQPRRGRRGASPDQGRRAPGLRNSPSFLTRF